jgi:hypothetical protein
MEQPPPPCSGGTFMLSNPASRAFFFSASMSA